MGFTLEDDDVMVSVPNKKIKSSKSSGFVNQDFDFQEGFTNVMKNADKPSRFRKSMPMKFKHKPIQQGAKILRQSTNGDRRRSRNKTFGIKGTPIKDGVRVIRKAGKRR